MLRLGGRTCAHPKKKKRRRPPYPGCSASQATLILAFQFLCANIANIKPKNVPKLRLFFFVFFSSPGEVKGLLFTLFRLSCRIIYASCAAAILVSLSCCTKIAWICTGRRQRSAKSSLTRLPCVPRT